VTRKLALDREHYCNYCQERFPNVMAVLIHWLEKFDEGDEKHFRPEDERFTGMDFEGELFKLIETIKANLKGEFED